MLKLSFDPTGERLLESDNDLAEQFLGTIFKTGPVAIKDVVGKTCLLEVCENPVGHLPIRCSQDRLYSNTIESVNFHADHPERYPRELVIVLKDAPDLYATQEARDTSLEISFKPEDPTYTILALRILD